MRVIVDDLKKGDIILLSVNSSLRKVELLEDPRLSRKRKKLTINGAPGPAAYINVLCKEYLKNITYIYIGWNKVKYTYKRIIPVISDNDPDAYEIEKKVDLNDKELWLINR